MDASAAAKYRNAKPHTIAEDTKMEFCRRSNDGSVSIMFDSDHPFDKNGTYVFTLTFSAAEIAEMHRTSIAGTVVGATEKIGK